MKKYFVLDTNVLLHTADSLTSFADNIVLLPISVIEELDGFKSRSDELGRNARQAIRQLDAMRRQGSLSEGVEMDNGGILKIFSDKNRIVNPGLDLNVTDNRIIAVAYTLFSQDEKVIFVSKDINARLKADALGLDVMDFEKQKVDFDELFCGYRDMTVPGSVVDEFFQKEVLVRKGLDLVPNEFVILVDEGNPKHTALARADGKDKLVHLNTGYEQVWNIKPRNKEQRMALELLMEPEIEVVTLVGQAGTGKTLLALAAALESTIRYGRYEKVLISRPIIPMGKDLGYMPGDKEEKLSHWMLPIFDNLTYLMNDSRDDEERKESVRQKVDELLRNNIVEMEALAYIRGRSIPRQYVIVDEVQNLTPHEVKTIISRAGKGTKMVLTGDPYQIDNPYLDSSSNGLTYTAERLKDHELHGHMTLKKSERSPLAELAANFL
ncbi:MAG: PhoH family protein [Thermodesulfobacteriota bacterium]